MRTSINIECYSKPLTKLEATNFKFQLNLYQVQINHYFFILFLKLRILKNKQKLYLEHKFYIDNSTFINLELEFYLYLKFTIAFISLFVFPQYFPNVFHLNITERIK